MKFKDLEIGVARFCKDKIMPKLTKPRDRFYLGALMCAWGLKAEQMVKELPPFISKLIIIDANGNIDIEFIAEVLRGGFEAQPVLPLWKLEFKREDLDDLVAILNHQSA